MTAVSTVPASAGRARKLIDRPALLLFVLVGIGELPLLLKFFADLWTRPQYDFYPLILVGSAYLAWDRLRDKPDMRFRTGGTAFGAILLIIAFIVLVLGNLLLLRYFGAVSALIALAGCICWIGGLGLLRTLAPSLVLLLTILPPPGRKDETIALNLRQWAVWASGRLLDVLQIPHVSTGTLINIAGHRLGVEEACSGIHSLLAVVAVTLMLGFYWRRPAWRIVTLMCCSVVYVVWANVLRIALGAYLIVAWKIDILSGSAHELLGLVLFMVCIALTASFDQFLVLLRPERSEPTPANSKVKSALPASVRGPVPDWAGWGIAGAFILLGMFTEYHVASLWPSSRIGAGATFSLPAKVGDWQRVEGSEQVIGRPEVLGQYSFLWTYRSGPRTALVACDYPFPGYHELAICYRSSGWRVVKSERIGDADRSGPAGAYTELELKRPSPAFASLVYGCCDERGNWLAPEPFQGEGSLKFRFELSYYRARAPQAYQVQALMQGFKPAGEEDKRQLRQLFLEVRDDFASQLARQAGGGR
jgi:exosortase